MSDLVFHQLEVGPLQNYVYLVGSRSAGEALVVDPAWEVDTLVTLAEREGLSLTGVLLTHTHPDHMGGAFMGLRAEGLAELAARRPLRVYVHPDEANDPRRALQGSESTLELTPHGTVISLGDVQITCIHTPGHTPGGQCFLFQGRLITGDTLFIGACGRVDLPGGDGAVLHHSLTQVLAALPDNTLVYPGHNYAPPHTHSTIGREKASNPYMR
ncbi:MAG: MBL fold metallo-hydrolase [Deltaproteobacteria bacterium]|nr:MBL fold metallo-hydrolase [Deltaproteobacteria bacterium]